MTSLYTADGPQRHVSHANHTTDLSHFVRFSKAVLLLLIIYVTRISFLVLFCFRAHMCIDALWLSAGKGLISLLSFVMSNCELVPFPLVSWVRCVA